MFILFAYLLIAMTSVTTAAQSVQGERAGASADTFEPQLPAGIARNLWRSRIPPDNPMSRAKVSLGQALYFDKRLSADGTVSCASCHDPANAFTDHRVLGTGVSNKIGTRNAPTILNAMFSEQLFWDGRVGSLEEQAKQPLSNPVEMGMGSEDAVVARVSAIPEYRQEFQRVFRNEGITIDTVVKAIAAYERTQLSANSPFDRFISGDLNAITEAQKRGWDLFKGKAGCIECHSFSADFPFFTDFGFHNNGIVSKDINFEQLSGLAKQVKEKDVSALLAHTEGFTELGRYLVTKQPKDIGAFKTPTLRDIELTTPYMHDGSQKTLIDVVRFYNRGGNANANQDKRMHPLSLSDEEMNQLVEFMRTLTSDEVLQRAQSSKPQTRTAVTIGPLKPVGKGRPR